MEVNSKASVVFLDNSASTLLDGLGTDTLLSSKTVGTIVSKQAFDSGIHDSIDEPSEHACPKKQPSTIRVQVNNSNHLNSPLFPHHIGL